MKRVGKRRKKKKKHSKGKACSVRMQTAEIV